MNPKPFVIEIKSRNLHLRISFGKYFHQEGTHVRSRNTPSHSSRHVYDFFRIHTTAEAYCPFHRMLSLETAIKIQK